jgi:hypothetical protein
MRRLILAALFALAACAAPPAAPGPVKPTPAPSGGPHPAQPGRPTPPVDAAACAARGGAVRNVCMLQRPMCVIPYADAGKACTDGDQCQGDCRYTADGVPPPGARVSGTCQVNNDPCGCFSNVEDGQITGGLCVD